MTQNADTRVTYEKTEIYEELVDEYEIFGSYVDFFVFAGCLGYAENEKREEYKGDNEMLWMHLGNSDIYRAVAAAIAYQDTGDPEALTQPETQLEILAKYAAGGAEIAGEEFDDVSGDPTNTVLSYIQQHHDPTTQEEQETILKEIMQSFDDEIVNSDA